MCCRKVREEFDTSIQSLLLMFSELVWGVESGESDRQGVAIDYPSLTMHGIVTHDPKYPEEHLVVIVQKKDDDDQEEENESKCD